MLELQYRGDPRFAGRMLVELSDQYRGQTFTRQAVALDNRAYALGRDAQDPELMALDAGAKRRQLEVADLCAAHGVHGLCAFGTDARG
jgi:hypothetical protein